MPNDSLAEQGLGLDYSVNPCVGCTSTHNGSRTTFSKAFHFFLERERERDPNELFLLNRDEQSVWEKSKLELKNSREKKKLKKQKKQKV